jgi:hypothetical protein
MPLLRPWRAFKSPGAAAVQLVTDAGFPYAVPKKPLLDKKDEAFAVKVPLATCAQVGAAPTTVRMPTRVRVLISLFIIWLLSLSGKSFGKHHTAARHSPAAIALALIKLIIMLD